MLSKNYGIIFLAAILLSLFATPKNGNSQHIYDLNKHLVQPEYQQFSEYDKPTVDSEGNLNLSITLGTIKSRNLEYPVTISYQSGIKVLQPSSWIGLGWNFNPGSITRTPSIAPNRHPNTVTVNSYDGFSGVDTFNDPGVDNAPDRFTVTIPGRGSTEIIQVSSQNYISQTIPTYQTGDFLTLDHKPWKIEYQMDYVEVAGVRTGIRNADDTPYDHYFDIDEKQDFSKFLITVEDGTRYLFGSPTLAYVDVQGRSSESGILKRQDYVGTWRLLAIFGNEYNDDPWTVPQIDTSNNLVEPQGSWIKLNYSPVFMEDDDGYLDSRSATNQLGNKSNYRQTQYLIDIQSPSESANFTTAPRYEPILEPWEKDFLFGNTIHKKLTNVNIDNKTFNLVTDQGFNPFPNEGHPGEESTKGRMRLKEIEIEGINGNDTHPGYKFTYENNPKIDWPYGIYVDEILTCMDIYGYYTTTHLGWSGSTYSGGCDASIDAPLNNETSAWSLASIQYPTGLKDFFTYESRTVKGRSEAVYFRPDLDSTDPTPDYTEPSVFKPDFGASDSESVYIGGPRVRKIVRNTNFQPLNEFESYSEVYKYESEGDQLIGIPKNYFLSQMVTDNNVAFSTNYSGSSIKYNKISIDYFGIKNTGSNYLYRKQLIYYPFTSPVLFRESTTIDCPTEIYSLWDPSSGQPAPSCGTLYLWEGNFSYQNGKISQISYVGADYDKLTSLNYSGTFYGMNSTGPSNHVWTIPVKYLTSLPQDDYLNEYKTLNIYQNSSLLISERIIDGESYKKVEYEHDPSTGLVKFENRVTQNSSVVKKTTRAHEISSYSDMLQKNMLAQVARVDVGFEEGTDTTWTSSTVTTWKEHENFEYQNPPAHCGDPLSCIIPDYSDESKLFWKPWKTFSWASDNFQLNSRETFSDWSSGSTPANWILNQTFEQYDFHGNLHKRTFPNGSYVTYTYNHLYSADLLEKVTLSDGNTSNPTELSTELQYDYDFRKVSHTKDPYGAERFYDYDDFGRLEMVKNKNSIPLSSYSYDYGLAFGSFRLNRVKETIFTNPTDSTKNYTTSIYSDGLARVRQSIIEDGNDYVVSHFDYDELGFLEKQWRPYEDQVLQQGDFTNPSSARTKATQYYRNQLNLGYDPNPYTRMDNHEIDAQIVAKEYPAWTDTEFNSEQQRGVDNANNITTINGQSVRFSRTIDESGNTQTTYINRLGQVVRQVVAQNTSDEIVTNFEYDEAGNLVKTISPRGLETTYDYNTLGQLTSRSLPDQDGDEKYKYDDLGNQRFIKSPNHQDNLQRFFSGGAWTGTVLESFTTISSGKLEVDFNVYDLLITGYAFRILDEDDETIYDYYFGNSGGSHNISIQIEPGTYTIEGAPIDSNEPIYLANGEMEFDSDNVFTYTKYDNFGRPIETGNYGGLVSFDQADPNDAAFPLTDKQDNIKYCYDGNHVSCNVGTDILTPNNPQGQLTKVQYRDLSDPSSSNWSYDLLSYTDSGLPKSKVTNLHGLNGLKVIDYHYDNFDRLIRRDFSQYDESGQNTLFVTWQEYDNMGRLEKVFTGTDTNVSNRSLEAAYEYTIDGQVSSVQYSNNNDPRVDTDYNIRGFLSHRKAFLAGQTPTGYLFDMELEYNPNGNISKQSWSNQQVDGIGNYVSYSYNYDTANRLTNASFSGGGYSAQAFDVFGIQYDDDGNLKRYRRRDNTGNFGPLEIGYMDLFVENNTNRIDYLRDAINYISYQIDYDANGNMTQNDLNGLQAAQYDWRNLPVIMNAGGNDIKYAYNAEGLRQRKNTAGADVHYVRGAMGETVAVYENNSPAFYNIFAGDEIIGQYDGQDRRYHVKDHLGSVRMTINDSQGIDGYQDYYPFGKIMPGRSYTSGNLYDNYKFTGHERDDEFDLTLDYMQARMYDPEIGRFLSVDPASQLYPGHSPYSYVLNNPINAYDPNGLWVVHINLRFRFGFVMGSGSTSIGLAFDQYRNIGATASFGIGPGIGVSAFGAIEVGINPFMNNIYQLGNNSINIGGAVGKGAVASGSFDISPLFSDDSIIEDAIEQFEFDLIKIFDHAGIKIGGGYGVALSVFGEFEMSKVVSSDVFIKWLIEFYGLSHDHANLVNEKIEELRNTIESRIKHYQSNSRTSTDDNSICRDSEGLFSASC